MSDSPDILRMRVLLCFFKKEENRTVMGISRTLKEAKQNVSRAMIALEKRGDCLTEAIPRMPHLTNLGEKKSEVLCRADGNNPESPAL